MHPPLHVPIQLETRKIRTACILGMENQLVWIKCKIVVPQVVQMPPGLKQEMQSVIIFGLVSSNFYDFCSCGNFFFVMIL